VTIVRLKEFTNAEEQLGLLRIIIDKTWTAIADQAAAQKKQQELDRIAAKGKPKAKGATPPRKPRPPTNNKPATPSAKATVIQQAYAQGQQAAAAMAQANRQLQAQQQQRALAQQQRQGTAATEFAPQQPAPT
jgi:hypothetical protein